jgi:hypothetical protein
VAAVIAIALTSDQSKFVPVLEEITQEVTYPTTIAVMDIRHVEIDGPE